jgi:RNA polymerase sigma-70 factor (ECF subfamily)
MVFTVARRLLGTDAAAEDVLQDSFVEIIRKASQYRGEAEIYSWIRRIAINKALSQLRSPWVRRRVVAAPPRDDADMPAIDPAEPCHDPGERIASHLALSKALDALAGTARAVVWLHDVEGYTHAEIGRLMGRSTSFSKSQLARAYRQLRDMLEPETTDEGTESCLGVLKTV